MYRAEWQSLNLVCQWSWFYGVKHILVKLLRVTVLYIYPIKLRSSWISEAEIQVVVLKFDLITSSRTLLDGYQNKLYWINWQLHIFFFFFSFMNPLQYFYYTLCWKLENRQAGCLVLSFWCLLSWTADLSVIKDVMEEANILSAKWKVLTTVH